MVQSKSTTLESKTNTELVILSKMHVFKIIISGLFSIVWTFKCDCKKMLGQSINIYKLYSHFFECICK